MIRVEKYNPGSYRNQGDYKSFVPSKINDRWVWESPRINHLLSLASLELGGLDTYSDLVPDIDIYIKMHVQVEANRSSSIEGTQTTIEEDMTPLAELSIEKRNDAQEVRNYIAAMNHGVERITVDDFPFTSRLMREMHAVLMQGVRGEYKTPGEFRVSQNFIGGTKPSDAMHVPPAVIDMQELMSDLDKFINRDEPMPTLVKTAIIHYQFETIHPFLDGNGRVGRLLIPMFLLARDKLKKPCFYISDYFEQHRTAYYDALQSVRIRGDMEGWICFFLQASIETALKAKSKFKLALKQVNKYQEYLAKKGANARAIGNVIGSMYSQPVATINELVELTDLSFDTISRAVRILTKDEILTELTGNRRNRVFYLHEYISVFS